MYTQLVAASVNPSLNRLHFFQMTVETPPHSRGKDRATKTVIIKLLSKTISIENLSKVFLLLRALSYHRRAGVPPPMSSVSILSIHSHTANQIFTYIQKNHQNGKVCHAFVLFCFFLLPHWEILYWTKF